MSEITLKLEERTVAGKKVSKLRSQGIVPSVVYGEAFEPINTQSPFVETTKVSLGAGKHTPVHLTIGGKKKLAIITSIDFHPVKQEIRHVAFHAIKADDVVTTEVPIHLVGSGESPAEKAGLVILQAVEHIEIKAKPANLPEALDLSVLGLEKAEDRLTVGDIVLPKGVEFVGPEQDLDLVVANVYEPSALQAANDAIGGDATSADAEDVVSEKGGDSPQGGEIQSENPGGKKAKEDHGE